MLGEKTSELANSIGARSTKLLSSNASLNIWWPANSGLTAPPTSDDFILDLEDSVADKVSVCTNIVQVESNQSKSTWSRVEYQVTIIWHFKQIQVMIAVAT
jgi:hypothetical protein